MWQDMKVKSGFAIESIHIMRYARAHTEQTTSRRLILISRLLQVVVYSILKNNAQECSECTGRMIQHKRLDENVGLYLLFIEKYFKSIAFNSNLHSESYSQLFFWSGKQYFLVVENCTQTRSNFRPGLTILCIRTSEFGKLYKVIGNFMHLLALDKKYLKRYSLHVHILLKYRVGQIFYNY